MISRDDSIQRRALRAIALVGLMSALAPLRADAAVLKADFNGDGREDLVVGSPHERVGTIPDAGAVSVFYGKIGGPSADPDLQWHQDTPGVGGAPGIAGAAEGGDLFGYAVAVGDFDRDGHDDLAIGVPGEDTTRYGNVGVVNVVYGSAFGLQLRRNHMLTLGVHESAGAGFGAALATGDFNGDGYDDLAVGADRYDMDTDAPAAGAVKIFLGTPQGLRREGFFTGGLINRAENGDNFGRTLVSADFDRDGFDDLAVGIPDKNLRSMFGAGAVEVLYGGTQAVGGSAPARSHLLFDEGSGTRPDQGDVFGGALTTGDFNCDAYPDLAIGHPGQKVGSAESAGAVTIVYGGRFGATGGIRDFWPASRLPGKPERIDYLGASLAGGDFNGDGCADLAIGVAHEDQERRLRPDLADVGHVLVLDGSPSGLRVTPRTEWYQGKAGVAGSRAEGDKFGWALSVGDFNRDDIPDLAIGVPGEKVGGSGSAGIVQILYGTPVGLNTNKTLGKQKLGEATKGGRPSLVEKNDRFGWALP